MYEITYKPSGCKIGVGIVIIGCYILALNSILSYYITYSKLATVIITLVSVLAVIRAVGIFSMYPGSFRYIAAQIEKRENDHLLVCIHKHLITIIKIASQINCNTLTDLKANHTNLAAQQTIESIPIQLNILIKSDNPSSQKIQLINAYKTLVIQLNFNIQVESKKFIIEEVDGEEKLDNKKISIAKIMQNSSTINAVSSDQQFLELQRAAMNCAQVCKKIWSIVESITYIIGPSKEQLNEEQSSIFQLSNRNLEEQQMIDVHKFEIAKWHLFQQKLFTINSYFALWDKYFLYQTFMLPIGDNNQIQCAIIYKQKIYSSPQHSNIQNVQTLRQNKQAVLFSNPNGMFVQTMGLASSYVKFYLKWGLALVLWNYRGYGKSTGISSVCKSTADIRKIYQHVTVNLKINIKVLHGYSIGGVCAISLAKELNQKTLRPIKLLIADRTFSSIDKMAKGFIKQQNAIAKFIKKISKPVVRTLFKSDCIDNSMRFIECQCAKICIWDTIDTIVDKRASLKHTILSHAKNGQRITKKNMGRKQNNTKQQSEQEKQRKQLLSYAEQFAMSSYTLFQTNPLCYQKVMKILCDTDGAGDPIFLPLKLNQDQVVKKFSKKYIMSNSQNYFIGLCIYGPKRDRPLISYKNEMKYIQKIVIKKINLMDQARKQMLYYEQDNEKCSVLIQSIRQTLQYVREQFTAPKYTQNREKYGHLIVSEVGHNCDLKSQYFYLEQAMAEYVTSQKEKEQMKQQKIVKIIQAA